MPVQIDRMDTTIELTSSVATTGAAGERRPAGATEPQGTQSVRDLLGRVLAEELDRFMRNRGITS